MEKQEFPEDPLCLLRNPLRTVSFQLVGTVQSPFHSRSNLGSLSGEPESSLSLLSFCHCLMGKSMALLSVTCFPSSLEMPRTWVLLPCKAIT